MIFKDFVKKNTPLIADRVKFHLENSKLKHNSRFADKCIDYILESSISGKMMRGNLFLLTSQIFGYRINNILLDIASSIEILQTGLLIHDDIMDRDLKRRNHDSIYASYILDGQSKQIEDPVHYGSSMAICAGDIAYFLVFEILSSCNVDSHTLLSVLKRVSLELQGVGVGQMMDVEFSSSHLSPTQKEIEDINLLKTSKYTFILPMVMACIVNKSNETVLFEKFGLHIGIIFQLRDDELGLFGDKNIIGKEVGSDIRENKKTLMRKFLYDEMTFLDRKQAELIFGKKDISSQEVDFITDLIRKYNVQEKVAKIIDKHRFEAKKVIKKLSESGLKVEILEELLDYVSDRNK